MVACKKLMKNPRTCVVVENAPLGVTSAIKAGCYCIGVESTCDKNQLSEAHETITDIANLLMLRYLLINKSRKCGQTLLPLTEKYYALILVL